MLRNLLSQTVILVYLYLLDLLEETEKLMKEKVEVQRQADKDNTDLLKHNKLLEAELEEQVSRVFELEQTQMTERRDLQQQVQALEKQLEKNRKFLDVSHRIKVQHSHGYAPVCLLQILFSTHCIQTHYDT